MALIPETASDTLIAVLSDIASGIPSATVPELFFSTTKRHGLDGVPVSRDTPASRVCPSCKTFEIDVELCPKCTRRQENRRRANADQARHDYLVRQENVESRLTEIAPDWREKFADWQDAEIFYLRPVQRTKDVDCGCEEPHDYVSVGSASDWEEDDRE